MHLNPQTIINSRFGIGLALVLGRIVPARIGYPLAAAVARFISRRKTWNLVRAARLNQWVVSGQRLSPAELDEAVQQAFEQTACCQFDLYHHIQNPESMADRVIVDPGIDALIKDYRGDPVPGKGLFILGVHVSNFDFLMHYIVSRGLRTLAITVSKPGGGYRWQNDLRARSGLEVIPASKDSFRMAQNRLQEGGCVLSGLDRPVPGSRYRPRFFGHPSALPSFYIPIALKARVPIVIVAAYKDDQDRYHIDISEPIHLQPYDNRRLEIEANAERVLAEAEKFIARAPTQWSMFYPVWPELMSQLP